MLEHLRSSPVSWLTARKFCKGPSAACATQAAGSAGGGRGQSGTAIQGGKSRTWVPGIMTASATCAVVHSLVVPGVVSVCVRDSI